MARSKHMKSFYSTRNVFLQLLNVCDGSLSEYESKLMYCLLCSSSFTLINGNILQLRTTLHMFQTFGEMFQELCTQR